MGKNHLRFFFFLKNVFTSHDHVPDFHHDFNLGLTLVLILIFVVIVNVNVLMMLVSFHRSVYVLYILFPAFSVLCGDVICKNV